MADLHRSELKKIMTTHEKHMKYNFVAPLTNLVGTMETGTSDNKVASLVPLQFWILSHYHIHFTDLQSGDLYILLK